MQFLSRKRGQVLVNSHILSIACISRVVKKRRLWQRPIFRNNDSKTLREGGLIRHCGPLVTSSLWSNIKPRWRSLRVGNISATLVHGGCASDHPFLHGAVAGNGTPDGKVVKSSAQTDLNVAWLQHFLFFGQCAILLGYWTLAFIIDRNWSSG